MVLALIHLTKRTPKIRTLIPQTNVVVSGERRLPPSGRKARIQATWERVLTGDPDVQERGWKLAGHLHEYSCGLRGLEHWLMARDERYQMPSNDVFFRLHERRTTQVSGPGYGRVTRSGDLQSGSGMRKKTDS